MDKKKSTRFKNQSFHGGERESKVPERRRIRTESMNAIEDLVQCGICLNQLTDPRMLPCQHTFCLDCLKTKLQARTMTKTKNSEEVTIFCNTCNHEFALTNGFVSLDNLPRNLHVESILKILDVPEKVNSTNIQENKCFRCRNDVDVEDKRACQHCEQKFCQECYQRHLDSLNENLSTLVRKLEDSEGTLGRKIEDFEIRCDRTEETVKEVIQQKILKLESIEKDSLRDISSMKREANSIYEIIDDRAKVLKKKIESIVIKDGKDVKKYMDLQVETAKILKEISYFGEAKMGFNPETLKIEQHEEDIYSIEDAKKVIVASNPFESLETLVQHFKNKIFKPKIIWNKCPRPGGLGIPPWDHSLLYFSAPDARCVFQLDRSRLKLLRRMRHDSLMTPAGICFDAEKKLTYVADVRGHRVHIFGVNGEHMGHLGEGMLRAPHGIAMSVLTNEIAICDTGHDRVVILNTETDRSRLTFDHLKRPESVAIVAKLKVVIADTGNDSIKIYDGKKGVLLKSISMVRPSAIGVGPFDVIGIRGALLCPLLITSEGVTIEIRGYANRKEESSHASALLITPELDILTADALARKIVVF